MKQLAQTMSEKLSSLLKPGRPAGNVENGVLSEAEWAFFVTRDRQAIGKWAEELSAGFLRSRGLRILDRNVRERFSELDIVARDGGELVFAEVRCRRKSSVMSAAETLGPRKWRRLVRGAELYTLKKEWTGDWRIDLVTVDVENGQWSLSWLKYLEMEES